MRAKLIEFVLLLVFAACLIAGCGAPSSRPPDTSANPPQASVRPTGAPGALSPGARKQVD